MGTKNKEDTIFKKKIQEIIDSLDIGYFKGELNGKLLIHNIAVNKILGLDPSIDLTGSQASQFISDPEAQKSYYDELTKIGYVKDFIVKIKNPKGKLLYIQLNSHLIKEDDQESILIEGTATNVTEKYLLEQSLKETEKRFNLIANNTNDLIAILNQDFEHVFVNEGAYYSVLGYRKEEILGKRPRDFAHPDDMKIISQATRRGLLEGEMLEEFRIKNKNGHYIWVETKGAFLKEKKKVIGAIFISRDITDKKEAEQRIKESEKKYRNLVNNLTDILLEVDLNGKVTYVSPQVYDVMGYQPNELIGKNTFDYIYPKDTLIIGEAMKSALKTKQMISIPIYRLLHKNGNNIFASARGKHAKTSGYERFIVTIRDITARTKIEQKLKKSEKKYRTLFESSTDGIYSTDMEGNFIETNKAFLNMLDYTKEELLNLNFREITPEKWYDLEDDMIFTQLSVGESKAYEKEYIRKNGTFIPIGIRFWILQDDQGDPHRIWAIVRDITETKQMEQKLKEINRIKSEFLRRASHELKTPLISIKGFADLILTMYSEELNPDIISKLEEIDKGYERLQSIINNLLHTSKLESPDLKPNLEKEDLTFLINYCVDELHPLAIKREHSLNIEIHESIITRFEKEEIHDVISNLLTNAIKYTPPRGWIDIRTEIEDNFVTVSIKDNGIGFTEEEKGKIFKQFGKIERYGQGLDLGIDGTGLGLYISKKIVESHGGKIGMESEGKNKGSTFYFSLPLIKD